MRRIVLIIIGLVCFTGFAIAAAPARLAFDLALRPAGVEAGLVQGTVWEAQALRIRAGGQSIAAAQARLDPVSLAGMSARFDVTLRDPELRAEGVAELRAGGAAIENASGVVRLSRILPELSAFAPEESARFEIEQLVVDGQGRCQTAQGRVFSTMLVALGERYGETLPLLQGELICAGDDVGLQLSGTTDNIALDGRLQFAPGGPEGRIEARTAELPIVAALSFAGFDQVGRDVYALILPIEEEG